MTGEASGGDICTKMKGRAMRLPFLVRSIVDEARSVEIAVTGAGVTGLTAALIEGCLSGKTDEAM